MLLSDIPPIFYVSEVGWLSGYMFLLVLQITLSSKEERKYKPAAAWIAPAIGIPLMIFYMHWGDILLNILWCGMMTVIGWQAIRGLCWDKKRTGELGNMSYFHFSVLAVFTAEFCLWTASCFWVSDTLTKPYFWFDFLLTAALFVLLPATRKAVGR